jgi:HK97 family phage major capsid protein
MNLKLFYDAAQAAEAALTKVSNEINELYESGPDGVTKGLAMKSQYDEAKLNAKKANDMYISKREEAAGRENPGSHFMPVGGTPPEEKPKEVEDILKSKEYFNSFFRALKMGVTPTTIQNGQHRGEQFAVLMTARDEMRRVRNALSGDGGDPVGEQGGFLQPVDFDNKIHELQRAMVDLAPSMNIENVTAYSGWRAVEQATALLPFAAMTPQVTTILPTAESPLFSKVEYTLADYAGRWPVSNDLLSDTPVAVMNYLARWAAKKEVLTNNSLILTLINALTSPGNIALTGLEDALRAALNTGLDPAISAAATIFTNQSGFNLLDQLEDGMGRPMLQPDVTQPTLLRYKGRPIVKLSDALWPLQSGRAPIAVGYGAEYLTFFRKASMQFDSTNIGGDAWLYNTTEVRAIMRCVAKEIDAGSMVLLKVALT